MMRQLIVFGVGFLLLTALWFPSQAQGGNLRQIIDARPDLSTLSAFVDASLPSLRRTLTSAGELTFFAPTDTAFDNLASFLDVPLADLIRDPIVVSQLLDYHILDGRFSGRQLATDLEGQVVPTRLPLAFVSVRVNEDSGISLNNVVEVIEFDINGSNGVIHIINDVLLNRIIAETLEEQLNSDRPLDAITPNPDSTATITATETPEQPDAPQPQRIALRIAHLAPELDAIGLFADDELLLPPVEYAMVSPFDVIVLDETPLRLATVETARDISLSVNLTAQSDSIQTLIILPGDPLQLQIIDDSLPAIAPDEALAQFFNAAVDDPTITLTLNDEVQIESLAPQEVTTERLPSGLYDLLLSDADDETLLLDPLPVSLWSGSSYFFALAGPADDLRWVAQATSADQWAALRAGLGLSENPLTSSEAVNTLFAQVQAADDLTIFAEALARADSTIRERLTDLDTSVTLLAPTDAAFEALLATLDMDADTFFSDTALLSSILRYHIIAGRISGDELRASDGLSLATIGTSRDSLLITSRAGNIFINGVSRVTVADTDADNGVLHQIDEVLLPQSALAALGL